jgi:hypothetical protein
MLWLRRMSKRRCNCRSEMCFVDGFLGETWMRGVEKFHIVQHRYPGFRMISNSQMHISKPIT